MPQVVTLDRADKEASGGAGELGSANLESAWASQNLPIASQCQARADGSRQPPATVNHGLGCRQQMTRACDGKWKQRTKRRRATAASRGMVLGSSDRGVGPRHLATPRAKPVLAAGPGKWVLQSLMWTTAPPSDHWPLSDASMRCSIPFHWQPLQILLPSAHTQSPRCSEQCPTQHKPRAATSSLPSCQKSSSRRFATTRPVSEPNSAAIHPPSAPSRTLTRGSAPALGICGASPCRRLPRLARWHQEQVPEFLQTPTRRSAVRTANLTFPTPCGCRSR